MSIQWGNGITLQHVSTVGLWYIGPIPQGTNTNQGVRPILRVYHCDNMIVMSRIQAIFKYHIGKMN